MKSFCPILLAGTLVASGALAAPASTGPLAPGKPAGVHKAQAGNGTLLWLLGAGLVIGGIALVATGGGGDQTPTGTTTSSTTGTTP